MKQALQKRWECGEKSKGQCYYTSKTSQKLPTDYYNHKALPSLADKPNKAL